MTKLQYKRLLVKFSGEAVAGDDIHGIDPKILDHMANSVKGVQELGLALPVLILLNSYASASSDLCILVLISERMLSIMMILMSQLIYRKQCQARHFLC